MSAAAGLHIAPTELLGSWQLERRVHDRLAGAHGRVTGTLELSLRPEGVRWSERGVLDWAGQQLDVTRELLLDDSDGAWTVRFPDGRVFHPWCPGEVVTHPCRADVYRGTIVIDPARTTLRTLWDVTGPAKQQRLFTRCRR